MKKHNLEIIFADKWIIAVNKPAGMLSVPFPGSREKNALDLLTELRRKTGQVSAKSHPFAVHRLDRETSGVLLFALTAEAKSRLMNGWQTIVSERLYVAVCEIQPRTKRPAFSGIINDPLAFNAYNQTFVPTMRDRAKNPRLETVSAVTRYTELFYGQKYARFELLLETGRKNQIRAHLAHLGLPIAGDKNYRSRTDPFGRLALHARTIALTHPFTGEQLRFEVREPAQWSHLE